MADHGNDHSKPARLVTFGSLIHLNLEIDFRFFLYGEGFLDTRAQTKLFINHGTVERNDDFNNCIFMILPFSNMSAFTYQKMMIKQL